MNPESKAQSSLPVGSREDPPLQASKWLQLQLLMDEHELRHMFDSLGQFTIYKAGAICPTGHEEITKEDFIAVYGRYIELLKSSHIPSEGEFRAYFSSVLTCRADHLFLQPIDHSKALVRVKKPCIQLQMNRIAYSDSDGKFRAMLFGPQSIFWGLQFSYPQLFQDATTKEVFSIKEGDDFPNTALFRMLQRWTRGHTVPTPFLVAGKQTNTSVRIGKRCFSWINNHPQLQQRGIAVKLS
jgi:hypothetical protein